MSETKGHDDLRPTAFADLRAKVEAMIAPDPGPVPAWQRVAYDAGRADALAEVLALLPGFDYYADLRAKVEALRRPPLPWVPIDDVLALLPEVSE